MSIFDFKHHKTTITGLLMRAQLIEQLDRKTGELKRKIVVQLICNNYDPETDTYRKPEVEQFSSKSVQLLTAFESFQGKIVSFPVSSMKTADGNLVYWIPVGMLPTLIPEKENNTKPISPTPIINSPLK